MTTYQIGLGGIVEQQEFVFARSREFQREAFTDYERIASELAGPDQTLRRVLLARLQDAHYRGRAQADHERRAKWEWIESL